MSLKASEQIVLDAIEHNLRAADPELAIAFESFTTVTANMALPASEQLGGPQKPTVTASGQCAEPAKITFSMRLAILFLVGMVLAGTLLALFSGARPGGCSGVTRPAFTQSKAASGLLHGRNVQSCYGIPRGK
jgi:hypothetical protein